MGFIFHTFMARQNITARADDSFAVTAAELASKPHLKNNYVVACSRDRCTRLLDKPSAEKVDALKPTEVYIFAWQFGESLDWAQTLGPQLLFVSPGCHWVHGDNTFDFVRAESFTAALKRLPSASPVVLVLATPLNEQYKDFEEVNHLRNLFLPVINHQAQLGTASNPRCIVDTSEAPDLYPYSDGAHFRTDLYRKILSVAFSCLNTLKIC